MTTATQTDKYSSMVLGALTAEDLMVANPVSVHQDLTVQEATATLIDKGFSAAPVIDDAGTPVGIVSRSDILTHDREKVEYAAAGHDYYGAEETDYPIRQVPSHTPMLNCFPRVRQKNQRPSFPGWTQ